MILNRGSKLVQQHLSDMDSDRLLDAQDITVELDEYAEQYYPPQQYAYNEAYDATVDMEHEGYESDQESVDYQHQPYSSPSTNYAGYDADGDHQNGNMPYDYSYDPVEDLNRNDATPLRDTSDPYDVTATLVRILISTSLKIIWLTKTQGSYTDHNCTAQFSSIQCKCKNKGSSSLFIAKYFTSIEKNRF